MIYRNPYAPVVENRGNWYKSNFHVHVDTGYSKKDVISLYTKAGYRVLTISGQGGIEDTAEAAEGSEILMIPGMENIALDGILCLGINRATIGEPQQIVDQCVEQGGFAVIAHPNFGGGENLPVPIPVSEIESLRRYIGIEIYNAVIFHRFLGSGLATDLWDRLLSAGKLVWGFANDDFHQWFDMDRAWCEVYADNLSEAGVKAAIERGSFYASSGLVLQKLQFDGNTLNISVNLKRTPSDRIAYTFIGQHGKTLAKAAGTNAQYRFSGRELYVRVQATSEHGANLWTQPIYDATRFSKP